MGEESLIRGGTVMKVKTYLVYLPELNIAFDQDKLSGFQKELDEVTGFEKTGINLNHTPYNKITRFTVAIWALGRTEDENREIMNKAEKYLEEKNIVFHEYESYLSWNEEKIYIEIEARPYCKDNT